MLQSTGILLRRSSIARTPLLIVRVLTGNNKNIREVYSSVLRDLFALHLYWCSYKLYIFRHGVCSISLQNLYLALFKIYLLIYFHTHPRFGPYGPCEPADQPSAVSVLKLCLSIYHSHFKLTIHRA